MVHHLPLMLSGDICSMNMNKHSPDFGIKGQATMVAASFVSSRSPQKLGACFALQKLELLKEQILSLN